MNHYSDQEIRYNLIKILSRANNLTQRDMAVKMGISLGKLNYCISELVKKGFIKIDHFKASKNKMRYLYILTPRGMEEKAELTLSFLKRKVSEYEEIKQQIMELKREIEENRKAGIPEAEAMDGIQKTEHIC